MKFRDAMMSMEEGGDKAKAEELMNEFKSSFESVAAGSEVLDLAKFKQLMAKISETNKTRYGIEGKGDDMEYEMWFKAYNMITSGKDGVSFEDMTTG